MKPTNDARRSMFRFFSCCFLLLISFHGIAANSFPLPDFFSSAIEKNTPYLRLNEVRSRAIRHFKKHFAFTADEKWVLDNDYYVANFSEGNVRNKVYYHTNGHFVCCARFYGENEMDKYLRSRILSKFQGSVITVVTEINDLEKKVYFVKIKDASSIKTLRCMDDEIEVTESYFNGGA